jgi:hypothetical protein
MLPCPKPRALTEELGLFDASTRARSPAPSPIRPRDSQRPARSAPSRAPKAAKRTLDGAEHGPILPGAMGDAPGLKPGQIGLAARPKLLPLAA